MKSAVSQTPSGVVHTFENGTTLEVNSSDSCGYLYYPPSNGVGAMGFPIRNGGDVLHALTYGKEIPAHCKAW